MGFETKADDGGQLEGLAVGAEVITTRFPRDAESMQLEGRRESEVVGVRREIHIMQRFCGRGGLVWVKLNQVERGG